jgi:hypothetical protein
MATSRKTTPSRKNSPSTPTPASALQQALEKFGRSPIGPVLISHGKGPQYTPYLLIRYAVGDVGDRPVSYPPTVTWESPDVWVTNPQGVVDQPVAGQPNQVSAQVTNLGLQQSTNAAVSFWWVNPSLGQSPSTANLIATTFATIPPMTSQTVNCPQPWVPILENDGHECILAAAYDPVFDPDPLLQTTLDPSTDRHIGQKNETLITVEPGAEFRLRLAAVNVSPLTQQLTIQVNPVLMKVIPPPITARAPKGMTIRAPQAAQLPMSLHIEDASTVFQPMGDLFARRLLELTTPQATAVQGGTETLALPQISKSLTFEPWENRTIQLEGKIPASAEPGLAFMYRIIQYLGPVVTGGYTIAVLVGNKTNTPPRKSPAPASSSRSRRTRPSSRR